MKHSLLTGDMIADFFARGGTINAVEPGVRTTTDRELKYAVRGEAAPVVTPVKPYERRVLKLKVGAR